jgi:lipid-A-disaccharide synthase
MKYYLIAGEASGDLHASNLMKEIRQTDPQATFRYWGGELMKQQGGELVKHYRDIAFMGFIEVLLNLREITRNLRYCKQDIIRYQPDAVILIDYPGFNLRIAKFAKASGLRVFYYISPQLWAWRSSRVKIIKENVDKMFVILPFEKDFYSKYGYSVDFIGHPLLDVISDELDLVGKESFIHQHHLDHRPVIALLPGSRKQEIAKMLDVMLHTVEGFPGFQFVIGAAPSITPEFYRECMKEVPVSIVYNQTYSLLKHAEAAIVTSGTATLETALMGIPQVVCYKGSRLSYLVARMIVHVRFISLVNLIMDKKVVAELIQENFNKDSLTLELKEILFNHQYRQSILNDYASLKEKLGGKGASAKAAGLIVQYLNRNEVK